LVLGELRLIGEAMRNFLTLSALVACLTATASATTLYGVSNVTALINITANGAESTWTYTNEGSAAVPGGGTVNDIAELGASLYETTGSALYHIALSGTGTVNSVTEVGTGYGAGIANMVALTFGSNGVLYGAEDISGSTDLYTINTSTGNATALPVTGATLDAAGDMEVIGNTLYLTTGGTVGVSSLVRVNLTTDVATNLGIIQTSGGTQFSAVYGLTAANGTLYAFDSSKQVLSFASTISNIVTVQTTNSPDEFYGVTDNTVVPEPSTFSAMGFGLLALGGLLRRIKA
jgi:hypothetical protein